MDSIVGYESVKKRRKKEREERKSNRMDTHK